MPALIFTANSGTDQLRIVGHGLVTGDGPGTPRNIGGVLPAPLVGLTDYWIIRDDNDHVRLATSSANALLGTAINLTTNGTGTNKLEIGIPYRRARNYVPKAVDVAGAQVKSADLNTKMDSFKALHALLTGQAQSVWSRSFTKAIAAYAAWATVGWAPAVGGYVVSSAIGNLYLPLPLDVGERLRKLSIPRYGDSSATLLIEVFKVTAGGVATSLGVSQVLTPTAAWGTTTIDFHADTGVEDIDAFVVDAFQRASGSFITDGFRPGMTVQPSGYANAGNNQPRVLTVVNALTMQVADTTGMVGEAGTGDERLIAVPPTVGAGESFYATFTSGGSAANLRIGPVNMDGDSGA